MPWDACVTVLCSLARRGSVLFLFKDFDVWPPPVAVAGEDAVSEIDDESCSVSVVKVEGGDSLSAFFGTAVSGIAVSEVVNDGSSD